MILSVSAESILDAETCLWVVPTQGILDACDCASAAFQTAIGVGLDVALSVERVYLRRAYEKAVFDFTSSVANLVVYANVTFLVNFEHVAAEFFFYLQFSFAYILRRLSRSLSVAGLAKCFPICRKAVEESFSFGAGPMHISSVSILMTARGYLSNNRLLLSIPQTFLNVRRSFSTKESSNISW